jgi:hypothetical protein
VALYGLNPHLENILLRRAPHAANRAIELMTEHTTTRRRSDKVAKAASALALAAETYGEALTDEVAHIVAADQVEALTRQSARDDQVLDRIELCETTLSTAIAALTVRVDAVDARLSSGIQQMHQRFDPVDLNQREKRDILRDMDTQLRYLATKLEAGHPVHPQELYAVAEQLSEARTA